MEGVSSQVAGRRSFALAARQREGGLALRLREAAGELREGLHEGGALGHAHLPQLHLLPPRPLLRLLHLHLPPLAQVRLVAQDDDRHLDAEEEERKKKKKWVKRKKEVGEKEEEAEGRRERKRKKWVKRKEKKQKRKERSG